jgi:heme-degrading monooxygenase HmoA
MKTMLESVIKSERKAEKMYSLYNVEASTRGHNAFALYSAFTNYASYADERNGFNLRNTGNDTNSVSMWLREQEVTKWVSSPQFKELVAA